MLQIAREYVQSIAQGSEPREQMEMMDAHDLLVRLNELEEMLGDYIYEDIAKLEKEKEAAAELRDIIENVRRYVKDLSDSLDVLDEAIQGNPDPRTLTPEAAMENVRDALNDIELEISKEQIL